MLARLKLFQQASRRAVAGMRVDSLERDLATQKDAAQYVQCPATLAAMRLAREGTNRDLATARAALEALHPPGTRFRWRDA